jgi:hypothetical protein
VIKVSENKIFFNLEKQTKHLSDYAEGVAYVTKSHKYPEALGLDEARGFFFLEIFKLVSSKCAWKAMGASIKVKDLQEEQKKKKTLFCF